MAQKHTKKPTNSKTRNLPRRERDQITNHLDGCQEQDKENNEEICYDWKLVKGYHYTKNRSWFKDYLSIKETARGSEVIGIGNVELRLPKRVGTQRLLLSGVLHIPDALCNGINPCYDGTKISKHFVLNIGGRNETIYEYVGADGRHCLFSKLHRKGLETLVLVGNPPMGPALKNAIESGKIPGLDIVPSRTEALVFKQHRETIRQSILAETKKVATQRLNDDISSLKLEAGKSKEKKDLTVKFAELRFKECGPAWKEPKKEKKSIADHDSEKESTAKIEIKDEGESQVIPQKTEVVETKGPHNWILTEGICYAYDRKCFATYQAVVGTAGKRHISGVGTVELRTKCNPESPKVATIVLKRVMHIPSARLNGFTAQATGCESFDFSSMQAKDKDGEPMWYLERIGGMERLALEGNPGLLYGGPCREDMLRLQISHKERAKINKQLYQKI